MIKKSVVLFLGSLFVLFFFGVHISHAAQSAPNTTTWGSDTTIASEIGSYYDFEFTSRNSIALSEDELPYVDIQFPSGFSYVGQGLYDDVSITINGTYYSPTQIVTEQDGIRIYLCEDTQVPYPCVVATGGLLELSAGLTYNISISNMQNPSSSATYYRPSSAITLGRENEGSSLVSEIIQPTPNIVIVDAPAYSEWESETNISDEIGYYNFYFNTQEDIVLSEDDIPYVDVQFPEGFSFTGVDFDNDVSINIEGTDYYSNRINTLPNGIRIYLCEDTQDPCINGIGGGLLELPAGLNYYIGISNMQNPPTSGTYSWPSPAITLGSEGISGPQVSESIILSRDLEIVDAPPANSEWYAEAVMTNEIGNYQISFTTQKNISLSEGAYIDIQFPEGFSYAGEGLYDDVYIQIRNSYGSYYYYKTINTIENGIRIYLCEESPYYCGLELPAGSEYNISISNIQNPPTSGTYSRPSPTITLGTEYEESSQVRDSITLSPAIEILGAPIAPSVEIKKSANYAQVISGDVIHYTIALKNPTNRTLGVMMVDMPMQYFGMDLDLFTGSMQDFDDLFGNNTPVSSSGIVFTGLIVPSNIQLMDIGNPDREQDPDAIGGCAIRDEGGIQGLICEILLPAGQTVTLSYDAVVDYSLYNYGDMLYNIAATMAQEYEKKVGGIIGEVVQGGLGGGTSAVDGPRGDSSKTQMAEPMINFSDVAVEYVQNRVIINSGGGGGGGYVIVKDNCPDGDESGDRYDGSCKKSTTPAQVNPADKDKLISPLIVNELIFNPLLKTCKIPLYIPTHYQENYVSQDFRIAHQMLYSYDITTWKGTEDYRPYENLTREQAAKLMVNFAKNILCRQKIREYNNNFSDIKDANPTLVSYVAEAYEYGIFNGNSDGTFKPNDIITRDELSATLVRLVTDSFLEEPRGDWAIYYRAALKNFAKNITGSSVQRGNVAELLYDLYKNNAYKKSSHGYVITH